MEELIKIPDGVKMEVTGKSIKVSGKLGEVKKMFIEPGVEKKVNGNTMILAAKSESRQFKRIIKTYKAHIKNMIKGVTEGFEYHMKIVFTHFPVTVKAEGSKLRIDNFIGERSPRYARVVPGADVKVTKQDVVIKGIDIDAVSQTAGNIERTTQIIGRDRRVFQDGIYITSKSK